MSQWPLGSNDQPPLQQTDLDHLFSRLDAREVEQFYQFYHTWQQQGRVEQLINEIETLQWQIAENDVLLRQAAPSTMVQADIALLETRGVINIDLLDRMVGRGEIWLNRAIDLLQRCEELNMIGETYEQWCEHALEGAYEWISTMEENGDASESSQLSSNQHEEDNQVNADAGPTEDALIQKLMSEEPESGVLEETDTVTQYSNEAEPSRNQDEANSEDLAPAIAATSNQGKEEQSGSGNDDNDEDSLESSAQQAEEDGIGDIEAQSPEDLEIEAQQVADFEQQAPEEDVQTDNARANAAENVPHQDESSINTQEQPDDLQTQTDGDRHWPYIVNTEEVEDDRVETSDSPDPKAEPTESERGQMERIDDEQEPQSLVQKLLTRVLRW